jgi:ABC-type transport system involved in multi-copper enzyme maturation permease subunit
MSHLNELARAAGILFQAHLWRIFRTRRALVAFGLTALPVVLALIVRVALRFHDEKLPSEVLGTFVQLILVQTIVPLVALVMASAVVAEEIEDRTITYLFTRPMPRAAILVGRWLAAALPIAAFLCLSAAGVVQLLEGAERVEGAEGLPPGFLGRILVTVTLGGIVYSALFASLGALFKRPMLIGLGYTFVYENFLGNLPGSNQKGTVLYYLRSFLLEPHQTLFGELSEGLFQTPPMEPLDAVVRLLLILTAALALASWRFTKREYVLAA